MKSSRPLELIYFNFLPAQIQEGIAYIFYAIDDYSEFAFLLDTSMEFSHNAVIHNIKKLIEHPNFISKKVNDYTIMASCGHDIEQDIKNIIHPNASITFDTDTVIVNTQDFVNAIQKQLGKH